MSEALPCPSWVWSTGSNAHAAKDRSWFCDDYTPFNSVVGHSIQNVYTPVVGIGSVILPVQRTPGSQDPANHTTIRLRNVLHIPSGLCNIIGCPIINDFGFMTDGSIPGASGTLIDKQDRPVAYFKANEPLFQIKVADPPIGPKVGPSPLKPGGLYLINIRWPDEERKKWERLCASRAQKYSVPPLTTEEKQWLKKYWKKEYYFLRAHGLSIYKDEDREEGRVILRALMADSEDE
ncbi:hypothetical protein CFIMG_001729RA [Ceratocystis fimbriata CBS 114723]|uniref:Uncharacterized protein n=1 Tax=Ceratocystis fimbriata CBS 114723 TaxID=1035309 RepID=A0A2C5XK85_9PEZI|nr:hypothetical protein CFIMG_001729RA [Ceratocystis fimbriata CBS 114723]